MSRRLNLFAVAALPALVVALPWILLRAEDHSAVPRTRPSLTLLAIDRQPTADEDASARRILDALAKPTKMEFVEIPLRDAVASLIEQHEIPIRLNEAKLIDEGVQVEQPVTLSLDGVRLETGLNLLLRPLQLTWVIRDEVLQITTQADADAHFETRIHPIQKLLKAGHDPEDLIDLLTSVVRPENWDTVGGEGTASPFMNSLVIRQTQEIQFEIRRFLSQLEVVAEEQEPGVAAAPTIAVKAYATRGSDAEELAKAILDLVEPASWESAGGEGAIRAVKGALLVKNTRKVHRAVERLLTDLKETVPAGAATGGAAATKLPSAPAPAPTTQPVAPTGNSAKPQPPPKR